jgi:hypothetical protein
LLAIVAIAVDRRNERSDWSALLCCNFLERIPKVSFRAHTRFVAFDDDRSFDNWRLSWSAFHKAPYCNHGRLGGRDASDPCLPSRPLCGLVSHQESPPADQRKHRSPADRHGQLLTSSEEARMTRVQARASDPIQAGGFTMPRSRTQTHCRAGAWLQSSTRADFCTVLTSWRRACTSTQTS